MYIYHQFPGIHICVLWGEYRSEYPLTFLACVEETYSLKRWHWAREQRAETPQSCHSWETVSHTVASGIYWSSQSSKMVNSHSLCQEIAVCFARKVSIMFFFLIWLAVCQMSYQLELSVCDCSDLVHTEGLSGLNTACKSLIELHHLKKYLHLCVWSLTLVKSLTFLLRNRAWVICILNATAWSWPLSVPQVPQWKSSRVSHLPGL